MIFKPVTVACMWDTWLYYENGTHYLFYLFNSRTDAFWNGFGLATSEDGVHFVDRGPIIHKADDAMWLGTGMTWKIGDKYYFNFSESRTGRQEVSFAESDDLLHWRRLPYEETVVHADPRWYADAPAFSGQRWDGIWVMPRATGSGYVGFVTAVGAGGPPGLCGTVGAVESDDGIHFRAIAPVVPLGTWTDGVELGAVEEIDGRWYMLMGLFQLGLGNRHIAGGERIEAGMAVLTADQQMGPYTRQPDQPMLLGASPWPHTYFARFYRVNDELLINHHAVARTTPVVGFNAGPDVGFSPLKRAVVNEAGILQLGWWQGNEALRGAELPVHLDGVRFSPAALPDVSRVEGDTLHCAAAAGAIATLPRHYDIGKGFVLEVSLSLSEVTGALASVGLCIEGQGEGPRSALILLQSNGTVVAGPFNGYSVKSECCATLPTKADFAATGDTVQVRILVRGSYTEIYVDDLLALAYTLPAAATGRIGFVAEAGTLTARAIRTWEMSL